MKRCPRGLIGTGQDTPLCIGVPGPKRDIFKRLERGNERDEKRFR
jgi:hypothetical protein